MSWTIKGGAAVGISIGLLAALPGGASAAQSCIFMSEKVTGKNQTKLERSLLCLTNVHRLRNGRAALPIDTRLAAAARAHSADMVARNFFDHANPEGAGPSARAAAFGYPFGVGENLATNVEGTVLKLFEQWRTSTAGHNENMLGFQYQAAGFGVVRGCCPAGSSGATGTQMFGVGPANTQDTALDFFASSNKCAKAKAKLYNLKHKKGKTENKKDAIRQLRKDVRKRCEPPV